MFTFIRKSLTRKITLLLFIIALLTGAGAYYYWGLGISLPIEISLAATCVFFILFIVIIYRYVSRPLKKITRQMKYILTGRSFKRIYSDRVDELGVIAQFFNEITENIQSVSSKLREQQRMSSELEIASNIQRTILPEESPEIPGLEVNAKTRPAVEVGGDNFDFIQRGDNFFIYVGDVTGHGVPAGLIMMMVNTLLHTYSEMYDTAYDIVVNTNRQLKPRIKASMFMTMVMLKWDSKAQKMTYVGAGHEHLLIYKPSTGKIEARKTGGVAIGMVPDNSKLVKEQKLELEEGDIVVIYSDGITEAKNEEGEMFGLERLEETIKKYAVQYGPSGIIHHTALDFSRFVGESEQEDDITMMAVRYTGKQKPKEKPAEKTTKW
jgi:serine phosphatase RsbU (regulator of sigma subunit)